MGFFSVSTTVANASQFIFPKRILLHRCVVLPQRFFQCLLMPNDMFHMDSTVAFHFTHVIHWPREVIFQLHFINTSRN